jgi:hypothetical protein
LIDTVDAANGKIQLRTCAKSGDMPFVDARPIELALGTRRHDK